MCLIIIWHLSSRWYKEVNHLLLYLHAVGTDGGVDEAAVNTDEGLVGFLDVELAGAVGMDAVVVEDAAC